MKDFEPDFSNKEAIIKFLNQIWISTEKELFKILKDRENQRKKLETKELKEIKKEYTAAIMSGSGSTFFVLKNKISPIEDNFWIKTGLKSIPHGICEK